MTFKLSVSHVIALFALLVFTSVYADHPFSIKGEGKGVMYVPDKNFNFTINPGSKQNYDIGVFKTFTLQIGGCSWTLQCAFASFDTNLPRRVIFNVYGQELWMPVGDKEAVLHVFNGFTLTSPYTRYDLSGADPKCEIKYKPVSPSGYKVEIEVSSDDIPPDFETYADYVLPSPGNSTTTTQSTSISTVEVPTDLTEEPTGSTAFPEIWHIAAMSVGLLLLLLLSSGLPLLIILRRRKKSKKIEEKNVFYQGNAPMNVTNTLGNVQGDYAMGNNQPLVQDANREQPKSGQIKPSRSVVNRSAVNSPAGAAKSQATESAKSAPPSQPQVAPALPLLPSDSRSEVPMKSAAPVFPNISRSKTGPPST